MSEPKKRTKKPRKAKPDVVPAPVVMLPLPPRRGPGLPREEWRTSIGSDIASLIHLSIAELSGAGLLQTDALEICLWPITRWLNGDAPDADLRASYGNSREWRTSFEQDDSDDQWRRIDLGVHRSLAWSISRLAGDLIYAKSDDGLQAQRMRSRMEFAAVLAWTGNEPAEAAFRAERAGVAGDVP